MPPDDSDDGRTIWADEIRERLQTWAAWTRGNQLVKGQQHVLARMTQRAAGEVPGSDSSPGYEFTLDIEVTDKAIARLKVDAQAVRPYKRRYMKLAKRILISVYLGRRTPRELAVTLNCSEDSIKSALWYAESYVGKVMPEVHKTVVSRRAGR